ncbi:MAG: sulfatase-like hydrolase/transferase [Lachnospiraceae bacterium]|nr:sulfatase-like hydrolase/transferase [Lachnospiraceae bacterium]
MDFVFTISVQGHGRYPSGEDTCEDHIQLTYAQEEMQEPFHYYVNQIYEMDEMMGELKASLDKRGEDYVLILYGDHLPSLNISQHQLKDSTLFQTEYVIVNNINLKLEDEDIESNEMSLKLLKALNLPLGYAQKAHMLYEGEELDEKLTLIAYDELFGDNYIFSSHTPVPEGEMKMGITPILINDVAYKDGNISVTGENFNSYSVIFINDKDVETTYVSETELIAEDVEINADDEVFVAQVDAAHHILSETEKIIFK